MSVSYVLGQSVHAEFRLELLNELTSSHFLKSLENLPTKHVRVLNIGCGSGHLEAKLSTIFSQSHFLGIDISEKRIEEARVRTGMLKGENTYEFIHADLTTLPLEELGQFDILISRFVLSHVPNPLKLLDRYLPLIKTGGFFCYEEMASLGSEYFCNTNNEGYQEFVKMVELQVQTQQSSFDVGFQLLSAFVKNEILYCQLTQAILRNARHKSILRLGIEDASLKSGDKMIDSLRAFEEDDLSFGLYTRTLVATIHMNQ